MEQCVSGVPGRSGCLITGIFILGNTKSSSSDDKFTTLEDSSNDSFFKFSDMVNGKFESSTQNKHNKYLMINK